MKAWQRWMETAELHLAQEDPEPALEALARAEKAADDDGERFETLLARARIEAGELGRPGDALATYQRAELLNRQARLERAGEAELGAGACLLQLERPGEARDRLQRAAAVFRRTGDALRRGCTLLLLAEEAAASGQPELAERNVEVATDLLLAAGEPRLLSAALSLHAELLSADGRRGAAHRLLERARGLAAVVDDEAARHDLRARRREILRTWAAGG